jgi:Bardet-Biedl syndrome 5 protein
MPENPLFLLWQELEIRFDQKDADLDPCKGEVLIKAYENIEDVKGNPGEQGRLSLTNFRILWRSNTKRKVNLSMGIGTISKIAVQTTQTRLNGTNHALSILASSSSTKFEFIFTSTSQDRSWLTEVDQLFQAYTASEMCRKLKLRTILLTPEKELIPLPGEQVLNKIDGVWNLSSDAVRVA